MLQNTFEISKIGGSINGVGNKKENVFGEIYISFKVILFN
jgi:hypothetical protein